MANKKIKVPEVTDFKPFVLPRTLINQLGEFSKDSSWVLTLKNEQNEIEVIENFNNRTDYMAFMVHLGVHANASLGCAAQSLGDFLVDENFDPEKDEED